MYRNITRETVDRPEDGQYRRVLVDLHPLAERIEALYNDYIGAAQSHLDVILTETWSQRKFFDILYFMMGHYDEDLFVQYLRWSMVDSDLVDDYINDASQLIQEYFMDIYGIYYDWLTNMAFYRQPGISDPLIVVFIHITDYRLYRPEGKDNQFPWFLYGLRDVTDRYHTHQRYRDYT